MKNKKTILQTLIEKLANKAPVDSTGIYSRLEIRPHDNGWLVGYYKDSVKGLQPWAWEKDLKIALIKLQEYRNKHA